MKRLGLLTLCVAFGAGAVQPGGTLYIRSRDTKLLERASTTAKALKVLSVGTPVTWQRVDSKDKRFHLVTVDGVSGFVLQSALTPTRPDSDANANASPPISSERIRQLEALNGTRPDTDSAATRGFDAGC